jgi:arylsulfatase A-like enzyme
MGRKILLFTTDQQRYDAWGVNGGTVARTPNVDALAAAGTTYSRCHPQSVVCMPSRSTIITGQHVSTHGVWMNGVALPVDAPSIARVLHDAGYRTAIFGKAHFEPFFDLFGRYLENALAREGSTGPHRGFEHLELATHGPTGSLHYAMWLRANHPEMAAGFYPVLDDQFQVNSAGGGDTGAPQVKSNPIAREAYHTDWVADRAIAWLESLDPDADWFCWVSFPDPHHPWDPPASERHRVNWRDLDHPDGYIADVAQRERVLDAKPRHWRQWYDGTLVANFEAPPKWVPATMTRDQVLEINANVHIENELLDEAIGRVMGQVRARGWDGDTDVLISTDHGEFQGDFGLMFKGPYHVDSLLRIPLIWRPAPSASALASADSPGPAITAFRDRTVDTPVGLVDLAPTMCEIAGIAPPSWMEGRPLPTTNAAPGREKRVLTEWDSSLFGVSMALRTMCRDGWLVTTYWPGTVHDGSEGELYNLADDPLQQVNRWDDPAAAAVRADLVADLCDALPPPNAQARRPLVAPV